MKTFLRRHGKKPAKVNRLTDEQRLALIVSLATLLSLTQSGVEPQQVLEARSVRSAPFEYRQANPYCHQLDYTGSSEQPTSIEMICLEGLFVVTILPWKMNATDNALGIIIEDATLYEGALGVTFSIVDDAHTWTCRLERVIQGSAAQFAAQTVDGGCVPTEVLENKLPGTFEAELVRAV